MSAKFNKDMTFYEALQTHPEVARVLGEFNLGCIGCMGAMQETLEQGAKIHGLNVDDILAALNAIDA